MRIAGVCKTHGFWKGARCKKCSTAEKEHLYITTHDWVTNGETWEHINADDPHYRPSSKRELLNYAEKHGILIKRFMKQKSSPGHGYEHSR